MSLADAVPTVEYASGVETLRWILLGVTILVGLGLLVLILVGWRRRLRRPGGIAELPAVPELAADAEPLPGKYVATTAAGDPLDRIAAGGLAFRGRAAVAVHPEGILIERRGEADLWLAREAIVGVDRATWTIDRVVEADGLQLIRWRLGDREVDTYLRMDSPGALDAAIAAAFHDGLELHHA